MANEPQPLTEAELVALAALLQADISFVESENYRSRQAEIGDSYFIYNFESYQRLEADLRRRGVLVKR